MVTLSIKHGTQAGYKAELGTRDVCERCRKAHLEYNRQFTKGGKARGLKYTVHDVIDDRYNPGKTGPPQRQDRASQRQSYMQPPEPPTGSKTIGHTVPGPGLTEPERNTQGQIGLSMADRVGSLLGRLTGNDDSNPYVPEDGIPEYIHEGDADPEPADQEWIPDNNDFVITEAGMAKIEDNLGMYLSAVGMTAEMMDPYCGDILAKNIDNMVKKWSKVVAKYPAAAKLFLDEKGGTLMAWIGALQSTWPVLVAIYHHHLARDVRVRNGVVEWKVSSNGQGPVDATMPPMQDDFAYSAT